MTEVQNRLNLKEDYAAYLQLEIDDTQDRVHSEGDETHIIFLSDHLGVLNYELNQVNSEIYLLRQKIKISENEHKFGSS